MEGAPETRTYGRGQIRAFSVRLRMLGRSSARRLRLRRDQRDAVRLGRAWLSAP